MSRPRCFNALRRGTAVGKPSPGTGTSIVCRELMGGISNFKLLRGTKDEITAAARAVAIAE
jgi:hypothetical protein